MHYEQLLGTVLVTRALRSVLKDSERAYGMVVEHLASELDESSLAVKGTRDRVAAQ